LVASLNRPGGNVTGVAGLAVELSAKKLELMRELVPTASTFALLVNPTNAQTDPEVKAAQSGGRSLGLRFHVLGARNPNEIDAALGGLIRLRAGALSVSTETFFTNQRSQIVALAARHRIPTMYGWREFPLAGGLISYGHDLADSYRQDRWSKSSW